MTEDQKAIMRNFHSDSEKAVGYFDKILEVESELQALLVEVNHYYGKGKYLQVENLIQPILDASNSEISSIYDFEDFSDSHYAFVTANFTKDVRNKGVEFSKECKVVLKSLSECF